MTLKSKELFVLGLSKEIIHSGNCAFDYVLDLIDEDKEDLINEFESQTPMKFISKDEQVKEEKKKEGRGGEEEGEKEEGR